MPAIANSEAEEKMTIADGAWRPNFTYVYDARTIVPASVVIHIFRNNHAGKAKMQSNPAANIATSPCGDCRCDAHLICTPLISSDEGLERSLRCSWPHIHLFVPFSFSEVVEIAISILDFTSYFLL